MWFRNVRLLTFEKPITFNEEQLIQQLTPLAFKPCPKSLPLCYGFVPPLGEHDAPLVYGNQGCLLMRLRIEEKVLPQSVVRERWAEEIKQFEKATGRRAYKDEKDRMKDEVYQTLLTKAFSKSSYVNGYIDTKQQWLIVDTASHKKRAYFTALLNKCIDNVSFEPKIESIPPIVTHWLLKKSCPNTLSFAQACLMKEQSDQGSVVRVKNADLQSDKIQTFLKDGSLVMQLALEWSHQIRFTLKEDFALSSLKFLESIKELAHDGLCETEEERFAADFTIMTQTLRRFLSDLLAFLGSTTTRTDKAIPVDVYA